MFELSDSCLLVPGFVISGGDIGSSLKKVELYNPASGNSCPVQDLQEDRLYHTSCSGLICGGPSSSSSLRSCEKISGTEVSPLPSLSLRQKRGSLCWSLPDGRTLLLGGAPSPTSTEVVRGISSSDSFQLPYKTE